MVVVGRVRKGAYFDSVTLMNVGREVASREGVLDAAVIMGTEENRAILAASDLLAPEFDAASSTDLLIAVRAESDDLAAAALVAVDELLDRARMPASTGEEFQPASLEGALSALPGANLVLISVAGRYAGGLARRALAEDLNVMLFSDNVPVETEIGLKALAREKGLLVMGPDCGTAILNGVPLAFANAVSRGDVGIVAASGTGLQEVSSIVSNRGAGVSQAIGTGGRDVSSDVGGITFLDALGALAADPATRVLVLVSKPPDAGVLEAIREAAAGIGKPVVSVFLGAAANEAAPGAEVVGVADRTASSAAAPGTVAAAPRWEARTLEEAALAAVALSHGRDPDGIRILLASEERDQIEIARSEAAKRVAGQRYLRGLMSGGTFTAEAQVVLAGMIDGIHSNAPTAGSRRLEDALKPLANTIVDLGADQFTVGRPHPMIDYSLRKKRIEDEAANPEVAVILLDVVLGYGSNPDPAAELTDVVREASERVTVVCSVTGTDRDPQNRSRVVAALEDASAIVEPSNAAASRLAGLIVRELERDPLSGRRPSAGEPRETP